MRRRSFRGFTLIELMVVIAVIAMLAAIIIPLIDDSADDSAGGAATPGVDVAQEPGPGSGLCMPVAIVSALLVSGIAAGIVAGTKQQGGDAEFTGAAAAALVCAPMVMPAALNGGPGNAWAGLAIVVLAGAIFGKMEPKRAAARAGAAFLAFGLGALLTIGLREVWEPLFLGFTWIFRWVPRVVGATMSVFGIVCG